VSAVAEDLGEPGLPDGALPDGARIRELRNSAGLTQRALAEKAGVSIGLIRDLEQGRTQRVRVASAGRLASALGSGVNGPAFGDAGLDADFCIAALGPLVVLRRGVEIPLGGQAQRTLLGLLAISADAAVHREEIADALWGGNPPASWTTVLQSYVSRLRRLIDPGHAARSRTGLLSSDGDRYRLHVTAGQLDLLSFRRLLADARKARAIGSKDAARSAYERALDLWRGEPLEDMDTLRTHPAVIALAAERMAAVLDYADFAAANDWHDSAARYLRAVVAKDPLDEPSHARLMIALAGSGRHAEALSLYRELQGRLDEELGVAPGPQLRAAHAAVLRQQALPPPASWAIPRQLPARVRQFTGRQVELKTLSSMLADNSGDPAATMVISAIGGTAGVGKTALAVHWAHQVADRFPDGQLYVNLRGYDPGQPLSAANVLAGFLRALGVPGQDIPPEAEERAARYRSLLAARRMLIVLDNAGSADQVRPLLPGTPGCTVLVTSRDALAGLVARDGATRLDLDTLPQQDAVVLLRALIGARVDADPVAAAELAGQCCQLPLALRVAAELAASRPAISLAALTGELADLPARLDQLEATGDPRTQVRTVFSWSYRHLDPATARTFRLLGLHPGPDLEPYAAAALTGTAVQQARRALDRLAGAHLIAPAAPGRHGMHDLLRGYAGELSAALDIGGEDQHAALTRLFDYYLHSAATAMDTLVPAERHRRPRVPRPATPIPSLADPAAARDWLDGERAALVAAAAHTAAHGWPGHATRLAAILGHYLLSGGHLPEADIIFGHALDAARRTGDRAAEASALSLIGSLDKARARLQQAANQYRQALDLFRAAGDRTGEALTLGNIGMVEADLGRYEQATCYHLEAIAIFRDMGGDRLAEARAIGGLGLILQRQGRYKEAADNHRQCLDLSRQIGDHLGETWSLARLGTVDLRRTRYQHAADYLQQALALARNIGSTAAEIEITGHLGNAYLALGRYQQATANFQQALALARQLGAGQMEASALNGLGEVLSQTGETEKARAYHTTALRLVAQTDSLREQASAHRGLARTYQASGDWLQARHHWQEALTRYTAIGAPEADAIRALFATAPASGDDDHNPTPEERSTTAPSPG
jgi:DNA-binding SARP family transcriptional activator